MTYTSLLYEKTTTDKSISNIKKKEIINHDTVE